MLPKNFASFDDNLKKDACKAEIDRILTALPQLVSRFHESRKNALLIVLQGLDASGKDGIVARCFASLPQDFTQISSFKKPSEEEYRHDFLWRIHKNCPPKGVVGIFNRSHYEDILVPGAYKWIEKDELNDRFKSIEDFEQHLERNGTRVLKFFLNISYDLQGEKLEERKYNPLKRYKHQDSDWETRAHWDDFMKMYSEIFDRCDKPNKWINVPADKKWQKDFIVLSNVEKALLEMEK